jgi:hypothetical protein
MCIPILNTNDSRVSVLLPFYFQEVRRSNRPWRRSGAPTDMQKAQARASYCWHSSLFKDYHSLLPTEVKHNKKLQTLLHTDTAKLLHTATAVNSISQKGCDCRMAGQKGSCPNPPRRFPELRVGIAWYWRTRSGVRVPGLKVLPGFPKRCDPRCWGISRFRFFGSFTKSLNIL